jgi:CRP-like cAMP-binding protein
LPELAGIEIVVFLQSADLFAYCKAEDILRIAQISHVREVAAGEQIYAPNDAADALYCVIRGEVALEAEGGEQRRVGPLGAFGVTELLSGRLRRSRAAADGATLLLSIDAEDFFDLLSGNIEIVKALFRKMLHDGQIAPV